MIAKENAKENQLEDQLKENVNVNVNQNAKENAIVVTREQIQHIDLDTEQKQKIRIISKLNENQLLDCN